MAVGNPVKDADSLKNDIMIETETLAKQGKRIAGMQGLLMVYASYKTSVENGTVYDVMDVIAVELRTWQPHGAMPPQVGQGCSRAR